jgi:hypothetical protein
VFGCRISHLRKVFKVEGLSALQMQFYSLKYTSLPSIIELFKKSVYRRRLGN